MSVMDDPDPRRAEAPSQPDRETAHVASEQDAGQPRAEPRARAPRQLSPRPDPAEQGSSGRLPALVDDHEEARPSRTRTILGTIGRSLATLLIVAVALVASLVIWDYYVTAPWTRDGRVRVQVAAVAPQVSGQITDLKITDNQFVHKGDLLYQIDRFDFQRTLETAQATLRMRGADFQVKKVQAERRQKLSDLATTAEEQQQYVGNAAQAQAAFDSAQQDVEQANVNLQRTEVRSPVNGYVTNLLMRVGDYAHAGTSNVSVIDADSYWIDGYFEETKMARVCIGDRAEAQLMGYRQPILGHVSTVTRGISVSDAAPSTQGLPSVDPIYTWVRLAQRVPVRVAIDTVPAGVPLVSGMTATVTIRDPSGPSTQPWYAQRWNGLRQRLTDMVRHPEPQARCIPHVRSQGGGSDSIEDYEVPPPQTPRELAPGLAPGLNAKPQPGR